MTVNKIHTKIQGKSVKYEKTWASLAHLAGLETMSTYLESVAVFLETRTVA